MPSKILATILFIGGLLAGSSALAVWLRDEMLEKNNLEWTQKLDKANAFLAGKLADREKKIATLEEQLAGQDRAAELANKEERRILDEQRSTVSLSDDCRRCRVPNARIWVRKGTSASAGH